jgi:hypothetical protein
VVAHQNHRPKIGSDESTPSEFSTREAAAERIAARAALTTRATSVMAPVMENTM